MNISSIVRVFAEIEQRVVAAEIVVQTLLDLRLRVALKACDNVGGVGQFKVSNRRRILFKACKKSPFGPASV